GLGVCPRYPGAPFHACGAFGFIIGPSGLERIERALDEGGDPVTGFCDFVRSVQPVRQAVGATAPDRNRS
ncbi:hypothetical protein, partial [Streptomyces sp. NPDC059604]|uniref:hypothetical protein n=1 Tax=Streptomyces sp. NPDC059604 TaxID=3346881 RepID=UPI0036D08133